MSSSSTTEASPSRRSGAMTTPVSSSTISRVYHRTHRSCALGSSTGRVISLLLRTPPPGSALTRASAWPSVRRRSATGQRTCSPTSPGFTAAPSWPTTWMCSNPVAGFSRSSSLGRVYPVPGMATVMHRGHTIQLAMSALMYVRSGSFRPGTRVTSPPTTRRSKSSWGSSISAMVSAPKHGKTPRRGAKMSLSVNVHSNSVSDTGTLSASCAARTPSTTSGSPAQNT